MVNREQVRPNLERWSSERGEIRVERLRRELIVMTYSGRLERDFMPLVTETLDAIFASGLRPELFNDLWDAESYDSEYRAQMTRWIASNRARFGALHILVRSKLVAMGASVVNLAVGGTMAVTSDREAFRTALAASLARHAT